MNQNVRMMWHCMFCQVVVCDIAQTPNKQHRDLSILAVEEQMPKQVSTI